MEARDLRDSLAKVATYLYQSRLVKAWNGWREGAAVSAERRLALGKVNPRPFADSKRPPRKTVRATAAHSGCGNVLTQAAQMRLQMIGGQTRVGIQWCRKGGGVVGLEEMFFTPGAKGAARHAVSSA